MTDLKPTSAADDLRPTSTLPDDGLWQYWSEMATQLAGKYDTLKAENAAQAAEIARLREALSILADDANWFDAFDMGEGPACAAWRGNGEPDQIARAALEGKTDD